MEQAHSLKASAKRYVVVWLVLIALTGLSYGASRLSLGETDVVLALAIAATKTTLVMLFFMHLAEARFTSAMIPVIAAVFVLLLAGLMVSDVLTRHTFPRTPFEEPLRPGE